MDIGQRIREARKARGLTLEALANQVDTDTGNLSRLERGKQGASQELLTKIFSALQLGVADVEHIRPKSTNPELAYNWDNLVPATAEDNRARKGYPLISWVIAGGWARSPDHHHPADAEWISSTESAGANGFWLKVRGDSMTCAGNPSFPEGSLILVRPESEIISGKYYVVEMLDSGEMTFKQYVEDAGIKYLRPLNPGYRTIEIDGNCRFIGRVIDTKMTGL